jgi:hypothetical protein
VRLGQDTIRFVDFERARIDVDLGFLGEVP